MIFVNRQPEPEGFDREVRQRGYAWLLKNCIASDSAPSDPGSLRPFWQHYNKELWDAYRGVCAYLAVYFDYGIGATTDHFIAKSRHAGKAYEWDNYRLACPGVNQRKNKYDDILDPFEIPADTFFLALDTGAIYVNPLLYEQNKKVADLAEKTIKRLHLDSPYNREMRVAYFNEYIENRKESLGHFPEKFLMKHNPFVFHEMRRQGLIPQ